MDPAELKAWRRALAKAEASGDLAEQGRICNSIATLYFHAGYWGGPHCWRRLGVPADATRLCLRGRWTCPGNYKDALVYHRQDLALSRALGDAQGEATAHQNVGTCLARYGGEHESKRLETTLTGGQAVGPHGGVLYRLHRYDKAIEHLQQQLRLAKKHRLRVRPKSGVFFFFLTLV